MAKEPTVRFGQIWEGLGTILRVWDIIPLNRHLD